MAAAPGAIALLMIACAIAGLGYLIAAPLWWAFIVKPMATRIRSRA